MQYNLLQLDLDCISICVENIAKEYGKDDNSVFDLNETLAFVNTALEEMY